MPLWSSLWSGFQAPAHPGNETRSVEDPASQPMLFLLVRTGPMPPLPRSCNSKCESLPQIEGPRALRGRSGYTRCSAAKVGRGAPTTGQNNRRHVVQCVRSLGVLGGAVGHVHGGVRFLCTLTANP
ncbi:hypothetical protein DPEC_G00331740 [Dallia pectoralis]|uniref:Uncharacterized protein n=1 Tax=Dallia pectoralis TaxID=75939 RepID=A0ACC2F5Y8_DALPE|nr:hypothetical protein DPEC_G00331740 [Dallia pectoralis]